MSESVDGCRNAWVGELGGRVGFSREGWVRLNSGGSGYAYS